MRTLVYSITLILVLGAIVMADKPKELGPEWKKKGEYYQRTVEAIASRRVVNAQGIGYWLPTLKNNFIWGSESDDGRVLSVGTRGIARDGDPPAIGLAITGDGKAVATSPAIYEVEMRKDESGKIVYYRIRLGQVIYVDLDGDGTIDIMENGKAGEYQIIYEGRFVDVEGGRGFLDSTGNRSRDHKIDYIFQGGKWQVKK